MLVRAGRLADPVRPSRVEYLLGPGPARIKCERDTLTSMTKTPIFLPEIPFLVPFDCQLKLSTPTNQ